MNIWPGNDSTRNRIQMACACSEAEGYGANALIRIMRSMFCFGEQTIYGYAVFAAKPDGTDLTQLTHLCDGEERFELGSVWRI